MNVLKFYNYQITYREEEYIRVNQVIYLQSLDRHLKVYFDSSLQRMSSYSCRGSYSSLQCNRFKDIYEICHVIPWTQ